VLISVEWAKFLDGHHVLAVIPIPEETARYLKPLRVVVASIDTGKITAILDLPRVEHVSAFSYCRKSSALCFAEEVNAHVYHCTASNIIRVCV
jgi:hypothetical protein